MDYPGSKILTSLYLNLINTKDMTISFIKKTAKKLLLAFAACILFAVSAMAQEDSTQVNEGPDNRPVLEPFMTQQLINQQTIVQNAKGTLEFVIQHRFGKMDNGFDDLWGLYAASNIRMGLNYGITDRIMVGLGTEKARKLTDINVKLAVLQQSRSGSIPLSLTLYGIAAIDGRDKEVFKTDYKFSNRMSYFAQAIVGRKFNDRFSFLVAPSICHFNKVDSLYDHDYVAVSAGGRVKITDNISAIFEYNQPIEIKPIQEYTDNLKSEYKPSMGIGVEIGTSTHAFQIFVSNSYDVIAQRTMGFNKYDMDELMVGFNITVRF
jgi:hypothetical protein